MNLLSNSEVGWAACLPMLIGGSAGVNIGVRGLNFGKGQGTAAIFVILYLHCGGLLHGLLSTQPHHLRVGVSCQHGWDECQNSHSSQKVVKTNCKLRARFECSIQSCHNGMPNNGLCKECDRFLSSHNFSHAIILVVGKSPRCGSTGCLVRVLNAAPALTPPPANPSIRLHEEPAVPWFFLPASCPALVVAVGVGDTGNTAKVTHRPCLIQVLLYLLYLSFLLIWQTWLIFCLSYIFL